MQVLVGVACNPGLRLGVHATASAFSERALPSPMARFYGVQL